MRDYTKIEIQSCCLVTHYGEKKFKNPHDVTIGPNGEIVIVDSTNHEVVILDKDFKLITTFGQGEGDSRLNNPVGVAVHQNVIAISEYDDHVVKKFSIKGNFLSQFGSQGCKDGQFQHPQGLCFNTKGLLYVVDRFHDQIQVFFNDSFIFKFGSSGSNSGQFQDPRYIAVDSNDQVYVSDRKNGVIQFSENGNFIKQLYCDNPVAISITPDDYIITSDDHIHRLVIFSPKHQLISRFGMGGKGKGEFVHIFGIAVDSSGTIFVTESSNSRLQII